MTPPQSGQSRDLSSSPAASLAHCPDDPRVFNPYKALESCIEVNGRTEDKDNSESTGPLVGGPLPSHCSRDDKEKLTLALSTLLDYLVLYGFRRSDFDGTATLTHWQLCSSECGWMKFLKYKLSSFFSDFLQVELPPCPFTIPDHPMHLVGGSAGRFVYQVMKTDRALSFATGVLYLKKGMPRPDEQLLAKALVATKKVLTTPRPVPVSEIMISDGESWDRVARPVTLDDMAVQVRRTCREVFGGYTITSKDLHYPRAPSIRADYVSSRSKFGTFGSLIDEGLIKDQSYAARDLWDSFWVGNERGEEEMEEEDVVRSGISQEFRDRVGQVYLETYETARRLAQAEVADVKLVALPEALKIRVISKGPPFTYFTLKPVQKFLHNIMRKHRMFKLVGETVSAKLLTEVLGTCEGIFHSLDYSSATDFLNPAMSNVAVREICASVGMPADLEKLFLKALTGHTVEGEPQVWGQLMGSIVSFIILCIVNAAVIRYSLELSESREYALDECPALVNGDDGAVRSGPEFLRFWKDLAALCGLEPSVGKVYSHSTYLNINSTSYTFQNGTFTHVPYVNMGLVMGMTRSGLGSSKVGLGDLFDERGMSLGARHHQLMESCPIDLRLAVHRSFVHHNWSVLSSVRLPWFVPESCGGVGLRPFKVWEFTDDVTETSWHYLESADGTRYGPSDLDQDVMKLLLNRERLPVSVRRLSPSQPVQSRAVWYTRKGFQVPSGVGIDTVDHQMSDDEIGFLDTAVYYLMPSLVKTAIAGSSLEQLRSNERAWALLSRRLASAQPE
jgi:hypothetical protein